MPADHGVRLSATAQVVAGQTPEATGSSRAQCSARRLRRARRDDALAPLAAAGDFSSVDPDEPVARCRILTVRAEGPGSAMRVRLMAVEGGGSVLRTANLGRSDMEVTRANETMMRAVAVFVGRAVRGAAPRHYRSGAPKRPKAPSAACRPVGQSGSDGRREALRGKGC